MRVRTAGPTGAGDVVDGAAAGVDLEPFTGFGGGSGLVITRGVNCSGVSFSTNVIASPGSGRGSAVSGGAASGSGGGWIGILAMTCSGLSRSRLVGVAMPGATVTA